VAVFGRLVQKCGRDSSKGETIHRTIKKQDTQNRKYNTKTKQQTKQYKNTEYTK